MAGVAPQESSRGQCVTGAMHTPDPVDGGDSRSDGREALQTHDELEADEPTDSSDGADDNAGDDPDGSTADAPAGAPSSLAPQRRARVPLAMFRAVLDAAGPSAELRLLWFRLWERRSPQSHAVRGFTQPMLAEAFRLPERTLRRYLTTAHEWGMLTIHRGFNANESWYVLHEPGDWFAAAQLKRPCERPIKRQLVPHAEPLPLSVSALRATPGASPTTLAAEP
jgi:hypothetical protein